MASNYVLNFSDPAAGTITLVPGAKNGPNAGTPLAGDERTDLRLFGENSYLWGEGTNENFLNLLENFASHESTATPGTPKSQIEAGNGYGINNPVPGQQWFNKTDKQMYLFNGTEWTTVGSDSHDPSNVTVSLFTNSQHLVGTETWTLHPPGPQTIIGGVFTPIEFYAAGNDPFGQFPTISVNNPATAITAPIGAKYVKLTAACPVLYPQDLGYNFGDYVIESFHLYTFINGDWRHPWNAGNEVSIEWGIGTVIQNGEKLSAIVPLQVTTGWIEIENPGADYYEAGVLTSHDAHLFYLGQFLEAEFAF